MNMFYIYREIRPTFQRETIWRRAGKWVANFIRFVAGVAVAFMMLMFIFFATALVAVFIGISFCIDFWRSKKTISRRRNTYRSKDIIEGEFEVISEKKSE